MHVTPIAFPLTGERVVAVSPPMRPDGVETWHRRINLYTGRTLSEIALTTEQRGRAGRLTLRGQMLSPGVVTGLEVGLVEDNQRLYVAPGLGLAANGQDVWLPSPLRVALSDLSVYATANQGAAERILGQFSASEIDAFSGLGILLLAPVSVQVFEREPDDPCEQDPRDYPFEDWRIEEGARLMLYPWPSDWPRFQAEGAPSPVATNGRRNSAAYAVFEQERRLPPGERLPWEGVGVPIGLLGLRATAVADPPSTTLEPEFVDRYSVVRDGGRPRRRAGVLRDDGQPALPAGTPFLWQARVQQLAEQMAEVEPSVSIAELASYFPHLPPVGLLRRDALEFRDTAVGQPHRVAANAFFPANFLVQVAPVPLAQLDVVMEASAALAPYAVETPDEVRVLVPVPQAWYEPELLLVKAVAPEFQQELDRLTTRRGRWLTRRADVRGKASLFAQLITGQAAAFPDPDPEALEEEIPTPDPIDPDDAALKNPELAYGTQTANTVIHSTDFEALVQELQTPDIQVGAKAVALLPTSDVERLRAQGLEKFIAYLRAKVKVADDTIDLNFLRVQTDIYRIRQLVLDNVTATRLATSPTLATIAKGETALATAQNINEFFQAAAKPPPNDVRDLTEAGEPPQPSGPLVEGGVRALPATRPTLIARDVSRPRDFEAAAGAASGATATRPDITAGVGMVLLPGQVRPGAEAPILQPGVTPPRGGVIIARPPSGEPQIFQPGVTPPRGEVVIARPPSGEPQIFQPVSGQFAQPVRAVDATVLAGALVTATPQDVVQQAPIVGKPLEFRTVSIAERIKDSPTPEAKSYSVATKHDVLSSLVNQAAETAINLDGIPVTGLYQLNDNGQAELEEYTVLRIVNGRQQFVVANRPKPMTVTLGDPEAKVDVPHLLQQVLQGLHDPDPQDSDEAGFFAAGIRAIDNATAILRRFEGRVQRYRNLIARCEDVLTKLQANLAAANQRLRVVGDELAEARHDVAVARALLADETARVDAINARRDQIIRDHVRFLVYYRPRLRELRLDVPQRHLDPGLVEEPVPGCLAEDVIIPDELRAMTELFRHAPLNWFTDLPGLLDRLDRPEILLYAVQSAKLRAMSQVAVLPAQTFQAQAAAPLTTTARLKQATTSVYTAQLQMMDQVRFQVAQFDLATIAGLSWQYTRAQAQTVVTLGSLIDGAHGNSQVARLAAQRLDQIMHIAGCLYALFGEVEPLIRLGWAELLSQYDTPLNLSNLADLPRWGDILFIQRREMQTLADWLYQRIEPRQPSALALMNDLVRICILLASHAPVNQIIAGHVSRPTTVGPGGRLDLTAVDIGKVRVGMEALVYSAERVVARAVVDDLAGGQVAARVVQVFDPSPTVSVGQFARVQFTPAAQTGAGLSLRR